MNEKLYFLNSRGLIKRKLTALFLSLILVVILSIYLIGCSDSGSSQKVYSTNSGIPIATLNQDDEPVLDVSSQGQVAWAQRTGDMDTIYSYLPDKSVSTIATNVYCIDIKTNSVGEIAWVEADGNDYNLWLYSNGEKEQITTDEDDNFDLDMNGSGHIVWTTATDDVSQCQINLYKDGTITQLTRNNLNLFPNINNNGEITWQELNGDNLSIYLRDKNGQVTKIIEKDLWAFDKTIRRSNWYGDLSSSGSVVWQQMEGEAIQIFMYSDGQVTQITNDDEDSRLPDINKLDQIVWEGYDGNDTEIFLYSSGSITQITDNEIYDTKPRINNHGQIVWESFDGNDNEIFIYDNGNVVQLTDNEIYDESPRICDTGQVFWITREPGEEFWYYANIMTTVPGQESRAEAASSNAFTRKTRTESNPESKPLPPVGTAWITAGEEADLVPQIESPAIKSPKDPDKFTFVVFGDTRGWNSSWYAGEIINKKFLAYFRQVILNDIKPDLVFYGGDISTYCNLDTWLKVFQKELVGPLQDSGIKVYMTKGNHECYKHSWPGLGATWYGMDRQNIYKRVFNWYPKNGPDSNYNNLAYYFTYGNSFFIIFDTYYIYERRTGRSDGHYQETIGQKQADWFANFGNDYFKQFKHKFAFTHAPAFSVEGDPRQKNMEYMWDLMTQRSFDIFFGSHEHLYSRALIPPNFGKYYKFQRELFQIIAGCGSESIDTNVKVDKAAWNVHSNMHFVVVKVNGGTLDVTTYANDTNYKNYWKIDSFAILNNNDAYTDSN